MWISLSVTDVLYHITGVSNAASIAERNRFELKPSEGTEAEEALVKGKFYLSTARSTTSAYFLRSVYSYSVILRLDGRKLGQKFQVKPVDYWLSNQGGGVSDTENLMMRNFRNEMEDRVLSDSQFIPNASQYITEIHAHVNEKRHVLLKLKKYALLKKIPIFFYADTKNLLRLNKAKAVPIKFTKDNINPPPSDWIPDAAYKQSRYKRDKRGAFLRRWVELYKIPVGKGDTWETAKKMHPEHGKRGYDILNYSDAINALKADMHNAKSAPYGDLRKEREYLDELVAIMRKNKQTPEQFIKALREKWYPRN